MKLDVEPDVDDVAVADFVSLAVETVKVGAARGFFGSGANEIVIGDRLRADEPAREVGVNPAGGVEISNSAYCIFFGRYISTSLSTRGSRTRATAMPMPSRVGALAAATPVSNSKTVFLPACGRPTIARFIYAIRNKSKTQQTPAVVERWLVLRSPEGPQAN